MSPAEVGLRVVRGVTNRSRRSRVLTAQCEMASVDAVLIDRVAEEDVSWWLGQELTVGRGRLLPGAREASALGAGLSVLGVERDETMAAAESILEGSVSAFGWSTLEIGKSPDWLRDPVSRSAWPQTFWADVDFRGIGDLGDPRYVWEVNRHHHLVTLGRAFALSGESRFAERVWRDIVSWVEVNPPLFGINWSSPLEIAIRLMSWSMALDLIGAHGARDEDAALVTTSVSLQADHLSDNLSVYASSSNNHLIGEAAGLLVVGAKFPFLRRADKYARRGKALLERELGAQVSADGVTREQAFQYQVFILEFALLGMAAARALGTSLASSYVETVGRMSRFLSAVSGTAGVPPAVGDDDGGRVFELSDRAGRQAARAAAVGAMAAGDARPDAMAASDLEPALWLFGAEPTTEFATGRTGRHGSDAGAAAPDCFTDGGYFVAAGGDHHGVIDCGPLGYLSIAAHGHADCLSLAVSHGGRWVLVDPGTYCYHRDGFWRDHFRSTAAHNTVSVDGLSQSMMLGPFMWGKRARAEQIAWASTPWFSYFEGAHDGYASTAGVRHRRSIVFGKRGYWLIVDHLEGSGRHRIDGSFQLAEGYSRLPADGLLLGTPDGRSAEFRTWLPEGVSAEVFEGEAAEPLGWVSAGFGRKIAAPVVVETGSVELPVTLLTAVVPFTGEAAVDVRCLTDGWDGGAVFEIDHPAGRDTVLLGAPRSMTDGGRFTGTIGFIAEGSGGATAAGLGVGEWTRAGSSVVHERVANILAGRE